MSPSWAFLDGIEEQVAAFLATFQIPEETVAELAAHYDQLTNERDETERERPTVSARLERIKELYKWGDVTREAYLTERDELAQRLAGLQGSADRAAVLRRVAALLRDLPAATKCSHWLPRIVKIQL